MADAALARAPAEVAACCARCCPSCRAEIIEAVGTVPAYSAPARGRRSASGSGQASRRRCATVLARSKPAGPVPRSDVYRRARAGARCAPGRSLDALLSAYRVGARVAWRRVAAAGEATRGSSRRRCTCWRSRSSPTSTCSRRSRPRATRSSRPPPPSEAELRRRRLVRLLVREPAPRRELVEAAAGDAGWRAAAHAGGAVAIGGQQPTPRRPRELPGGTICRARSASSPAR